MESTGYLSILRQCWRSAPAVRFSTDSSPLTPATDAAVLSRVTDGAPVVASCNIARRPARAIQHVQ
ncbi:hypothetical protein [Brooklawnia sp.]|uniref:hypothetical protein n=1 Tax=Brooklawnia sp. TaxID=2699740 RepID=UPI00311F30D6